MSLKVPNALCCSQNEKQERVLSDWVTSILLVADINAIIYGRAQDSVQIRCEIFWSRLNITERLPAPQKLVLPSRV